MKKKNKEKTPKSKKSTDLDEIRKLNSKEGKGHPHYVCGRSGNKFQSVGITHAKHTKGTNNIPLKKNPDPKIAGRPTSGLRLQKKRPSSMGKNLMGLDSAQRTK